MSSLQDQLLKAGLVDAKEAKKVKKQKAKQAKVQRKSSQPAVDETRERAKQAQAEKAERDRQLNQQRNADAERKALKAQVRQLIEMNQIRRDGDLPYNFKDGTTIKKIHVTAALQDSLARGQIAIVKLGETYQLVPAGVADKISQRDPESVIAKAEKSQQTMEEDDPYADYQIPDDLMW